MKISKTKILKVIANGIELSNYFYSHPSHNQFAGLLDDVLDQLDGLRDTLAEYDEVTDHEGIDETLKNDIDTTSANFKHIKTILLIAEKINFIYA